MSTFRKQFAPILIAFLAFVSLGVFAVFTHVARKGLAERRSTNATHLRQLGAALRQYADEHKAYPAELNALFPKYVKNPAVFVNPSWPDEAGYVYVTGAMLDDHADTILIFENTPARKQKLGRQILLLNFGVSHIEEAHFQQHLQRQEQVWKSSGRQWRLVEAKSPPLK